MLSLIYAMTGIRSFALTNFAIVIITAALFISISSDTKLKRYSGGIALAYIIRLFLLYFDLFGRDIYILPNSGADTEMFYREAIKCAQGSSYREGLFIEVLGWFFKIVGDNRLYIQYLLMLCSIIALVLLAITIDSIEIKESGCGESVFFKVCSLPNLAVLSSILARESIVCLFASTALLLFVRWFYSGSEMSFFGSVGAVLVGSMFHSGIIAMVIAFAIVRLIYDQKSSLFRLTASNIISSICITAFFIYLYNSYGDSFFSKFGNIDSIGDISSGIDSGGSSYARYVGDTSSVARMAVFTLPRMIYFVFSPLPWQWRGVTDVITFLLDSTFYITAVWNAVSGFIRDEKPKSNCAAALPVLIWSVILAVLFVFGWGTSNSGTAIRHRAKLVSWFALLWVATEAARDKQSENLNDIE